MSFLAPWALALAALVAVPLLLHLRRREATRRVAFPAIRHLSRAREATARSLRTADLLLLAVRAGLLLLIALAAAGALVGRGGPEDHRPTDLAIVVDNTASTGRVIGELTVLERLLERARDVVDAAGPADRFWILPAVGAPVAAGAPAGPAGEALGRVPASDGGADLGAAVAAASALLPASGDRAPEVVLLSDLQATGFDSRPADAGPTGASPPPLVVYRPPPAAAANGAVASATLESGSVAPVGPPQTLVAEVRRFPGGTAAGATGGKDGPGPGPPAEIALRLEVDGETAGATVVGWGGAAGFRLPDLAPGPHRGRVEIDPDGLRSDDARHFAFRVVAPPRVTHEGPAASFVALALETLREAGWVGAGPEWVRVIEGTPAASGRGGAVADDPAGALATVFLPPANPIDLPAFNQLLERAGLPWRLRPDTLRGELSLADAGGVPGLTGARIRRRYLAEGAAADADRAAAGDAAADADDPAALLATEDGRPWLLRHDAGGRRALLLLSPLLPEATSVPVEGAMIPFLEALLLRWSRPGEAPETAGAAGVAVSLPPWAAAVRGPDREAVSVEGGAPFLPLRAGVYELSGRGSERAYLAANVPEAESDLRPLEPARLQELFPRREVDIAGPGRAAWRSALYRARRGVSATPWLLALALAAAAFEAALAAPGRDR